MYTTAKRFPASCRFYAQGNCRAGQDCHFAHILPLSNSPKKVSPVENVETSYSFSPSSSSSLQKVIRDIEINQLEKKYSPFIQKLITDDFSATLIEFLLPIENKQDLNVTLIIPPSYPDTPCTMQIQNLDLKTETTGDVQSAFEEHNWPQMQHPTLVQQLNWLISHFNSL